jgi:iron complex outermembrane recepter protein
MIRQVINRFLITSLFCLAVSILAFAQNATTGTISGKVTYGADNSPLHNASVQIVQLKRTIQTNEDGSFTFENLPPGSYTLLAHQDGFSDITKTIVLTAGASQTADLQLQVAGVKEQVTVTASGAEQSTFESFQSVSTVASDQITQRASTSLGEVLEGESGVSKRSFGSGSSRPVIRGFDGDRVLVAQDGVRTGSLASQSGDHGEPVDTLSVERIEVVKGPATLLYGSNAIGGVVNVISNHEDAAHKGVRGFFTGLGGTNNNQFGTSGGVEYGYKKFMVFGDGSFQRTGDYHTPLGVVPNSSARSKYGSVGGGYFDDKGFFTTTFNYDTRRYGIPYAGFIESGGVSNDEEIDIRARTYNVKFNGGFRDVDSFVTSGKFTVNFNKYRHEELVGEEVGTTFFNKTISYRGTFEQKGYKNLTGRFGFEGFNRNYETVGAEQLIDGKVRQNSFSVFGLEELKMGRVSFQFGGRVERNNYNPENPALLARSFTGFSGAAGIRVGLWKNGAFVANYSNSYRAPALEELYNNGPHVGTVSFEIGNQNLERERANGIDFGLRHQSNRVRAEFNFFYYRINNFVYLAYVDEDGNGVIDHEDNLPVARYSQGNSQYYGAEFNADVTLHKYVNGFFNVDFVRAKLVDEDLNLPRIPPAHARIGLDFHRSGLSVRPELYFAAEQNRLYPLETRTAGYGIFNLAGSYTYGTEHYAHIFSVNGYNLFNKEYRNHLSFIKDLAPEIGRGVRFSYTIRFF